MYKIYNCLGELIGNPKGYKTHKGALARLSYRTRGSVHAEVWNTYNREKIKNPTMCRVFSIILED